jgi:hypothetical protein
VSTSKRHSVWRLPPSFDLEFTWDSWWSTSSAFNAAREHITFGPNSVALNLPASKTNLFRNGVAIQLAASPTSPLCPVRALRQLFTQFPRDPFRPLNSLPDSWTFQQDIPHHHDRRLVAPSRYPYTQVSGHSVRKAAAVSAAAKGLSRADIKLLGRWKSDAVNMYINEISQSDILAHKFLQLNSQLHQFTPLTHFLGLRRHSQRFALPHIAAWPIHACREARGRGTSTIFPRDFQSKNMTSSLPCKRVKH